MIHQKGGVTLGGVYPNGTGEIAIRGAHADGADLAFTIDWGWAFRVRPEGANLHVVINYGGDNTQEGTAVPATEAEMRVPAAIPPPVVRTLPDNGLARTPPMGWNSWNHFAEKVDDATVRAAADAMVSSGHGRRGLHLRQHRRHLGGRPRRPGQRRTEQQVPGHEGARRLRPRKGAEARHLLVPWPVTCGGYEGSYGHEEQDAKTYAAWGIDYLKYDWCSAGRIYGKEELRAIYQRMGDALERCGRPIVYSLCEYGMGDVWTWAPAVSGNLWRTTDDISDNWKSMDNIGFDQGRLARTQGPATGTIPTCSRSATAG